MMTPIRVFLTKAKIIVRIMPMNIPDEEISRFGCSNDESCFLIPTKKFNAAISIIFIIINKTANFLIRNNEIAAIETIPANNAKNEQQAKAIILSVQPSPQHFSLSCSLVRLINPVTIDIMKK